MLTPLSQHLSLFASGSVQGRAMFRTFSLVSGTCFSKAFVSLVSQLRNSSAINADALSFSLELW